MGCRDQSRVRARWCAAAVIFAVGDLLDAPDKLLRLWENSPKCSAGRPSPPESCPCGPFCPKGIPPSPNESVAQNKNAIPRILYDPGDFNISAASQALYGQEQGSATKSSITSIKWMGSSCPCVHSCARRCACWALVQISGTNAICRQPSGTRFWAAIPKAV